MRGEAGDSALPGPRRERACLSGALLVYRRQRRGRKLGSDLLGGLVVLALIGGTSIRLASLLFSGIGLEFQSFLVGGYLHDPARLILRGLMAETMAAAIVLPCVAAALGTGAAPRRQEREDMQAALLTNLSAGQIVAGRLLAALIMPAAVAGLSLIAWLGARVRFGLPAGGGADIAPVLTAHVILFCEVLMFGAGGMLFAQRSGSGRSWPRGAGCSLCIVLVIVFGLFALDAPIRRVDNPTPLIETALLVNPVAAVCTALNRDALRIPYIYQRTAAAEYAFAYPPPLATAALFALVGLAAHIGAAARFRRLYRC